MSDEAPPFGLNREREDDTGWLRYPLDKPLRQQIYGADPLLLELIMTHPAKQNAYLHQDICEYVSKPGETILDPFGGAGTSLLSAVLGRNVVLVEIEAYYTAIIQRSIAYLESQSTLALDGPLGRMTVVNADNRTAMPIPCDHIITSPPYGDDLFKADAAKALNPAIGAMVNQYGKANQNIGRLPKFVYERAMKQVYAKMTDSVRPGGTITITHRDRIADGKRVLYIDSIIRTLMGCGMKFYAHDKWKAPGSIQSRVNEKLGNEVILDEDIIVMRKPL